MIAHLNLQGVVFKGYSDVEIEIISMNFMLSYIKTIGISCTLDILLMHDIVKSCMSKTSENKGIYCLTEYAALPKAEALKYREAAKLTVANTNSHF